MSIDLKKELPIIGIVAIPFLYLFYIWADLPAEVPLHWNFKGEIDRYGSKTGLIWIPILLPLLIYVLLMVMPTIDPKNQLNKMGNKLHNLKFLVTAMMSLLALFILYSAKTESIANANFFFVANGVLILILGNYFKTIKPNYFIGIRTPWTLESEEVWKSTHELGGKLWFVAGIFLVISSLVLDAKTNLYLFIGIVTLIALIPIIYSYNQFNKLKRNN